MTILESSPPSVNGIRALARARWRESWICAVVAVLSLVVLVVFRRGGSVTYVLTAPGAKTLRLPEFTLPVSRTGLGAALLALVMAAGCTALAVKGRTTPWWYRTLFTLALIVAFLTWAAAGNRLQVPGLLAGSLALSVPLVFGALGGIISERVGVINVSIEGQLLAGAFASATIASLTHSLIAGVLSAALIGVVVALVLAAFTIAYQANQVIVGVVINVLILGATGFLYSNVIKAHSGSLNSPPVFQPLDIPILEKIPIIGPLLFQQNPILYLGYLAVGLTSFGLFRTRWGLRLRAVGEHPTAAATVGIDVRTTRYRNMAVAGAIVGVGGSYFTLGSVGAFTQNITSGAGFIALAAVIFGRWDPLRATVAAMLFGFTTNLQFVLGQLEHASPVPSQFLLMLPYVVTLAALAGTRGNVSGPAAAGKPYVKN